MDRNQFIGLALIFILMFVYFQYIAPPPEQIAASADTTQNSQADTATDSSQATNLRPMLKGFEHLQNGKAESIVWQNDELRLTFSTQGAYPQSVELINYKTYQGQPLYLLQANQQNWSIQLPTLQGMLDLSQLYYQYSQPSAEELVFEARPDSNSLIRHVYRFRKDLPYLIDYHLEVQGLENSLKDGIQLSWQATLYSTEKDVELSRNKSTITYYTQDGGFDDLSEVSKDPQQEKLSVPIWIGFKQHFFTIAVLHPAADFEQAQVALMPPSQAQSAIVKHYAMEWQSSKKLQTVDFQLFFGPNKVPVLAKVGYDFERNVYLGWALFRWVNRYMIIPLFSLFEQFIDNYGLIIILLVLVVKTLLFPLTYRSYLGMGKMKVLQPELNALKDKYSDPQELQMAQMELFRQVGVNPLSGCLPMLLQLPILFALFMFFPNAIELRQESFLWAEDLSTYDSILNLPFHIPFYGSHVSLFTLLMTLSSIAYAYYSSQHTTTQAGPMKYMGYIMPVMFMFILNSFPAGLNLYYFCSNVITIAQQLVIRRFVDDNKIRAILEENKKRQNGKASSFQKRLEEAIRRAQQKKKQS